MTSAGRQQRLWPGRSALGAAEPAEPLSPEQDVAGGEEVASYYKVKPAHRLAILAVYLGLIIVCAGGMALRPVPRTGHAGVWLGFGHPTRRGVRLTFVDEGPGIADLELATGPLDLVFVESGGDNLTATFSKGLVDAQIFVIDVAGGDTVALQHSFHGRTMGSLSVTWDAHYRDPFVVYLMRGAEMWRLAAQVLRKELESGALAGGFDL